MDGSPTRSGPPAPSTPKSEKMEVISTPEIQQWMGSVQQYLGEICTISADGKLNSEQKLRIANLCRQVGNSVAQLAVQYQSLKQKAIQTHVSLQNQSDQLDLAKNLTEIKQTIKESCTNQAMTNSSFADMVKKGTNSFVRPTSLSSVAIYPSDRSKTSDETKTLVQKIVCPEEMQLKVRGVRNTRNGGVIISTESKTDLEKLKQSVQLAKSGLTVDETQKRKPRIIIIGVPTQISENEVFKCIYEQNIVEKVPSLTRDSFLSSMRLSHKSGKKDATTCNYILEVSAVIRKALITQDRVFINWTSCPVRDFTLVTRCYKCQQYGHAAKTCKTPDSTCGHCGQDGHSIQDCKKKSEAPKCATCVRFKKPSNHKTGDTDCPAKKAAELRYINSIDYEGA